MKKLVALAGAIAVTGSALVAPGATFAKKKKTTTLALVTPLTQTSAVAPDPLQDRSGTFLTYKPRRRAGTWVMTKTSDSSVELSLTFKDKKKSSLTIGGNNPNVVGSNVVIRGKLIRGTGTYKGAKGKGTAKIITELGSPDLRVTTLFTIPKK